MFRLTVIATVCTVVLLLTGYSRAQTVDDEGIWLAFFGQGNIRQQANTCDPCHSHQLKWWFDGHARFLDDAGGFNQSIVRPGIGLSLGKNSAVWAGYGWIKTSPLTGTDFDEHRVWQQWTWSQSCEPITFALRSRLEQRFLETGDDTGWRFRQLFRTQYALPTCTPVTLVGWDELFIHLNDTDWGAESGFNQNRVFVGFGLKRDPSSRWRTEIGYLNQSINVTGGGNDRSNHILSINFYRSP